MDIQYPRYSTSEALLEIALEHARTRHSIEARMIKLRELSFRACEGYYSKSAHACTWPCSISQMDPKDGMHAVYENLVFWADVVLVATPIRWGSASSLYFKMAERLNTVQNQITLRKRVMLKDKVAGFIITGGQDNVQSVAGQMLQFFGELGMQFPRFPFIAHSRGWTAEDMERNVEVVKTSEELHAGARALLDRCLDLADALAEERYARVRTRRPEGIRSRARVGYEAERCALIAPQPRSATSNRFSTCSCVCSRPRASCSRWQAAPVNTSCTSRVRCRR